MGNQPAFVIDSSMPFFIFDSSGEWHATLINGCLWDTRGEYLGFVRGPAYDVYTMHGQWVGNLTPDGRVVRKRLNQQQPVLKIRKLRPPRPQNLPPRAPLPPLTKELGHSLIDVLEWDPDIFDRLPDTKDSLK